MPVTRTQAGETPRKTERPGYVETPGTFKRPRSSRKSGISAIKDDSDAQDSSTGLDDDIVTVENTRKNAIRANGHAVGSANGTLANGATKHSKKAEVLDGWERGTDPKVDHSGQFEFAGPWGPAAMMLGFPLLMYYMWIGATYYDGKFPTPAKGERPSAFVKLMAHLVYTGAYPSLKAWAMYWGFLLFEAACYILLPGIWVKGKPLPHEGGKRLDYYCSGMWSWWTTIAVACILHVSGIFKLYTIIDQFGPLLSVAIISGYLVSIIGYFSALYRGAQHRMTGYFVYDFFMGAELNPRLFGILDFKMFFEVRLPWYILFLLSLGTAARQYEQFGFVSGEVCFLLLAHFLYANACSKGEECIVPTWDMYYEKWGFMLIFWNMAGVPLSYCHCTIYVANHAPSVYAWNKYALAVFFISYLFVYWVWDTTNSQKNRFRAQESGPLSSRKAFPQLPWQTVKNPKIIKSENGGTILADGWYGYARKIHYTCDLFFALSWGLITGFKSPFPWFYPVFFFGMIIHRALRDIERCRARYGKAWEQYEKQVPYLFIPYIF